MNEFINHLQQFTKLSDESKNDFVSKCKEFEYAKGHILIESGQVCNYIYYVKSGIGKVIYYKDGKEIIDWISDEGAILSSVISFLSRRPSLHVVKLLEPSKLIGIHYSDLEELFHKHHDLERMGRMLTTHALIELQERINAMQFETAKQRYDNFLIRYPKCINRISLGDLASYLGMTQVTLSRIRTQE